MEFQILCKMNLTIESGKKLEDSKNTRTIQEEKYKDLEREREIPLVPATLKYHLSPGV